MAEVEPDEPAKYVDQAARKVIEKYGYGDKFLHRTGHGIGGVRIEDDVLVTKNGHKVLTSYPKDLKDVIL